MKHFILAALILLPDLVQATQTLCKSPADRDGNVYELTVTDVDVMLDLRPKAELVSTNPKQDMARMAKFSCYRGSPCANSGADEYGQIQYCCDQIPEELGDQPVVHYTLALVQTPHNNLLAVLTRFDKGDVLIECSASTPD